MHKKVVEITCDHKDCTSHIEVDKTSDCPKNWLTVTAKNTGAKGRPVSLILCPKHSRSVVKAVLQ